MRYKCKQCQLSFDSKENADAHEYESGHSVELMISSTYWGEHLSAKV